METEKLNELQRLIDESDHIVFFGGAGVSTESGIPDFRSQDGLYNQKYDYPPEVILSHTFFVNNPVEFFRFYRDKMLYLDAEPNAAHIALAKLEKRKKLKAVITQNIDGLHQKAGSNVVLELHGSVHRNYCTKCGKSYGVDAILNSEGVPRCECGGIIKPDVVLYEEPLDEYIMSMAAAYAQSADVFIVGGTSLSVYPAAGFVYRYMGDKLILINKSKTNIDKDARLVFNDSIGEVFSRLKI
ncbi:MAG TPA: NAD-dependent protein deacylase [Candidatus Ornithomonoglobus intestinigallinarum]|uniref:NAD-dependent protein deacetylase n=1 Tax=Candidatus Ornithomonoglobus intestinigallinarum TaxID=2840894 RepID=A0A9D1H2R7_9FIRM|nr:NAD-dependent protein deacylase [Candidatus Ornithomonoglobus intestinigallinarum]